MNPSLDAALGWTSAALAFVALTATNVAYDGSMLRFTFYLVASLSGAACAGHAWARWWRERRGAA